MQTGLATPSVIITGLTPFPAMLLHQVLFFINLDIKRHRIPCS